MNKERAMKRMLIANIVFLLVAVPLAFSTEVTTLDARKHTLHNFVGYVPNRIVVKFDPSLLPVMNNALFSQGRTGVPLLDELGMRHGSIRIRPEFPGARKRTYKGRVIDLSSWYEVTFSKRVDVDALVMAYKSLPGVIDAQPISIQPLYATPNDQFYDMQWHLSKIQAPEAWDVETGNPEIIVAVPDTGVRYFMKDLGGSDASYDTPTAVNGNMWINWAERNGQPGVDDDGNGFIDDWIGWDFVEDAKAAAPGFPCFPGEDCGGSDNDPRDFNGHGTHCAGSIGAINHNSEAVSSPSGGWGNGTLEPTGNGVKVMPLRIGWSVIYFGFEVGGVDMSYAAQAFQYAADQGAKIVSCSWGSDNTGGIQDAIDYFLAAGGLIFKAAGNDGYDNPDFISNLGGADYEGIINVAATDSDDCLAWFSNYGSWVNVSAPGVDIWSCFHDHNDPVQDYVTTMDGTSMAAPLAASVAALIWSQDPTLSAVQVKDKLLSSADNIDQLSCNLSYAGQLGAGRVNAYNAVSTFPRPLPDLVETSVANPPPAALPGGSFSVTDTVINQGTGSAGPSTTRYYLSTDTTKSSEDKLLGTRSVPALEPGAASTGTQTVTVPTTTTLGTYYLLACADDSLTVAESNETNNCIASAALVQVKAPDLPDLIETSVSDPPALVALGGSFSVTDTVINQGTGSAGPSTTRYYLSTDTTKSSGDKPLGTRSVPTLGPGAASTGTQTVTVPTTTTLGTYYLLACADDSLGGSVAESNETNNCIASGVVVEITP
jgi:subtilisin family serine protease